MPRVNLYLNEEDFAKWQKLDNKSEWVRDQLDKQNAVRNISAGNLGQLPSASTTMVASCKIHGTPLAKGKCLQKGCKYS